MAEPSQPDGRATGDHLGDDVVDLALGAVDGRDRAAMAAHLLRCPACRRDYDEVAASLAALLPGVPAVQPPLGFDERVVGRLGARPRAARRGARVAAALGAAVASVAIVAAVAWWAGGADGATDTVAPLRLVDRGGTTGTVSLAEVDGTPLVVVAIVDAPDGVSYFCRVRMADGTAVDSASWPPGDGAWIVPVPQDADPSIVEVIVSGTEHVWSSAALDPS